ncbi:putative glucosamine 6-phosphate acetyltransferase [Neohortaea acidophila]|uniref:Glucosamine 6-phosphate N-acetyltransferase n=1 Tax=Neohortaea acidophila TaxID=245834 RepID=A0A6A6Q3S1_9PEZI|nr:putative glucosamine 6-phosphate acetyltransferase [Neohortaea acidophila]KAF2486606.1 putative glucosamine 6-phosphate acetyltransferase [Neohortaea acidophila]
MASSGLFSPRLIDKSVSESFPPSYSVRPLSRDDYNKGFFECLHSLTWTGDVSNDRFVEQFDWMAGKDIFYVVVIEHDDKVIGTGVIMVGRKYIWDLARQGHIEDVSISDAHQGKGLGKLLLKTLASIGHNVGCGKIILNCSEEKKGFYENCGYEHNGLQMSLNLPGFTEEPPQ